MDISEVDSMLFHQLNANISFQSHPLPTLRNLKRLFILGDGCFFEVFLFEFAFLYEALLFLTNALQQYACWLIVGVLGYKATFDGFLQYGVA